MIDTMKTTYQAKEFKNEFELLPKGAYEARIVSIAPWKPKDNPTLNVFEYDDRGRKMKDEKGKEISRIEKNVRTYTAQVVFEIIEGAYDGARVYYNLNAHPNQPWAIPAFLNACQVEGEVNIKEIPELCADKLVQIVVDVEPYPYKTTDKVTGATKEEIRERNVVKRIKPSDLGI